DHLLVHGYTHRGGIPVVPLERRLGSRFADALFGDRVDLGRRDARLDHLAQLTENPPDQLVHLPQLLDLRLRTADNHDYALAAVASLIIMSSSCATLSGACAPFTTRNVGRSR